MTDIQELNLNYEKPSKKERRAYKKRRKKAHKKLKKITKTYGPWDWGYLQDFIKVIINDMYDYYNEGVNVWQADSSRLKVVNQLLKAQDLLSEIDKFENGEYELEDFESVDDYLAAEQKAYDDFYTFLGKNIRWWWD